ncbi:MAG TPA: polysaccharide biosynthesis C-terminal domain-containing protein [Chitinophagaceae bacterium]
MIRLIQKTIGLIFKNDQGESHFSDFLIRNSVQLLLLNGCSLLLGFVSNYVLIRFAGVSDYGSYVYIFNLLYLLLNFCIIGTDTLLIKKISVYDVAGSHGGLKGIIFFGMIAAICGSIVISIISEIVVTHTKLIRRVEDFNWLVLSVSSLLMLSITAVSQASLQGLKKIISSHFPEKILKPLVIIIMVGVVFFIQKKVSVNNLVGINLAAMALTLVITFGFLMRAIGGKLKTIRPKLELSNWTYSALSFFFIGMLYVLNSRIDIFILGLFRGNDEISVYNIALKISDTVSFGLVTVNFVLAPVIARLFANNGMMELQRIMRRAAEMVLFFSLPVLVGIIFLRHQALGFFKVDFFNGSTALLILGAGQLINVVFGSVGTLLMMTGNQKFSIYALILSTVLNIIFNITLTPKYGIIGTSIATAASLAMWNVLMYFFARRKLKIETTAF